MATLVRWTPFGDLDLMERRMRRPFQDVAFEPPADVYETPAEFVLELDVPGFEEKDLVLEVTDHTLVVKGHLTRAEEGQDKTFLLHERLERMFERRFHLPEQADAAKLTAAFDQGVLEIHAPKTREAAPRTIAIARKK